jgi:hypothetical protein
MVSLSAIQAIGLADKSNASPLVGEVTMASGQKVSLNVDVGTEDYTVLLDCDNVHQAVLSPPIGRLTVKNGKLVAWRRVDAGVALS